MMQSFGYKTDHAYLETLMEMFASFDDDENGLIEPHEFEQLYAHLVCAHRPPTDATAMRRLRVSVQLRLLLLQGCGVYVTGRCPRR